MPPRALLAAALFAAVLFALDLYVYRRWRAFARRRRRLQWTLGPLAVTLPLMPFVLPTYLLTSAWWAVEPRGLRAAVIGFWAVYYVPRFVIAAVIALSDLARGAVRLFAAYRRRLTPGPPVEAPPDGRRADAATSAGPTRLDLSDMARMSRAEFLRTAGWGLAGVPFVVVGYSAFRTLYDFQVLRIDVPVAGLAPALDGLTVAQLSDLHAGSLFSPRPMEDAVDLVLGARPDVVAITGDFVNHDAAELATILPALGRLRAPLGVYGCLGNHDHYADVAAVRAGLAGTPLRLLVNEHASVRVGSAALHVAGVDNTGFGQRFADLPRALAGLPPPGDADDLRVLLAHDPTFWDLADGPRAAGLDLTLSGHTHGGQMGVEWGPLRWSLARPTYPRWAGLYTEPGAGRAQHLYVNRGLGTVGPPIRLGIRPEVTLLTLRRV